MFGPLFVSLSAALAANEPSFPEETYVPWSGGDPHEVFTGFMSEDLALDLVVFADDRLEYVEGCGSIAVGVTAVASGVIGAALLDGGGEAGSTSVAYSTASGLFRLRRTTDPVVTFATVDLQRSAWAGRPLFSARVDGEPWIASQSSTDLQVERFDGSGLVPQFDAPLSGVVNDVAAMDWNGSGGDELLVLVDDRLEVYDASGTKIRVQPGLPGGQLAISRSEDGRDVALWEFPSGVGGSTLVALHADGLAAAVFSDDPGGLVALDRDGDGADDLVRLAQNPILGGAPGDGIVFDRIGSGLDLGSMWSLLAPVDLITTAEGCFPVDPGGRVHASTAGDFDNDGDADLCLVFEDSTNHDVRIRLNGRFDEEARRLSWGLQPLPSGNGTIETATLTFQQPADPALSSQATHLLLEMWHQTGVTSSVVRTPVPGAAEPKLVPFEPAGPVTVQFVAPVPPTTTIRAWLVTQVVLDGQQNEIARGPSNLLFYSHDLLTYQALLQWLPHGCEPPDLNGIGVINGGRGSTGGGAGGGGSGGSGS